MIFVLLFLNTLIGFQTLNRTYYERALHSSESVAKIGKHENRSTLVTSDGKTQRECKNRAMQKFRRNRRNKTSFGKDFLKHIVSFLLNNSHEVLLNIIIIRFSQSTIIHE